ncbi:MAG: TetR/AcrR family transcriptional regulator C-terminal domain-containing protein [Firmicutes bacterium]|nr:TetR/AcrR family transcriptional regulator C-terminal domain-containing protein [Bacillota bacterium]MBQ9060271.1 TetR/AcrR family transcriptional regulator C-terminal domain-containing protein [Bacillota bacterium]
MSKLTQRAMAQAISQLLQTRTLDKITIKDITDACGLTRNTFYYHFHDVYDLLRWLFEEKTREITERYEAQDDWEGGLEETLHYLYDHRDMFLHIYESISDDLLLRFINEVMYQHAEVIVRKYTRDKKYSERAIWITATFYMDAAVGDVFQWISSGMNRTPEHLAQVYNTLFHGTVQALLDSAEKAAKVK